MGRPRRKLKYRLRSKGYSRNLRHDGVAWSQTYETAKTFDQAMRKAWRMLAVTGQDVEIRQVHVIGKYKGMARVYHLRAGTKP